MPRAGPCQGLRTRACTRDHINLDFVLSLPHLFLFNPLCSAFFSISEWLTSRWPWNSSSVSCDGCVKEEDSKEVPVLPSAEIYSSKTTSPTFLHRFLLFTLHSSLTSPSYLIVSAHTSPLIPSLPHPLLHAILCGTSMAHQDVRAFEYKHSSPTRTESVHTESHSAADMPGKSHKYRERGRAAREWRVTVPRSFVLEFKSLKICWGSKTKPEKHLLKCVYLRLSPFAWSRVINIALAESNI